MELSILTEKLCQGGLRTNEENLGFITVSFEKVGRRPGFYFLLNSM